MLWPVEQGGDPNICIAGDQLINGYPESCVSTWEKGAEVSSLRGLRGKGVRGRNNIWSHKPWQSQRGRCLNCDQQDVPQTEASRNRKNCEWT